MQKSWTRTWYVLQLADSLPGDKHLTTIDLCDMSIRPRRPSHHHRV